MLGLGQTTLVPVPATSQDLNAAIAPLVGPTLTPANIAQPLPDITALAPVPVDCSEWAKLNALIAEHPVISVVVLSLLFMGLYPHKKGRR